jgi:hypothetical protein
LGTAVYAVKPGSEAKAEAEAEAEGEAGLGEALDAPSYSVVCRLTVDQIEKTDGWMDGR